MNVDHYDIEFFDDFDKAVHQSIILNFKRTAKNLTFGVIHGPEDNWAVVSDGVRDNMDKDFINIPSNYVDIDFDQIKDIFKDNDQLPYWETIRGMVSVIDADVLRFILSTKVPLEKVIRYELACRGLDTEGKWCGFEQAEKIWLEN